MRSSGVFRRGLRLDLHRAELASKLRRGRGARALRRRVERGDERCVVESVDLLRLLARRSALLCGVERIELQLKLRGAGGELLVQRDPRRGRDCLLLHNRRQLSRDRASRRGDPEPRHRLGRALQLKGKVPHRCLQRALPLQPPLLLLAQLRQLHRVRMEL